jgi:hypothetical protein
VRFFLERYGPQPVRDIAEFCGLDAETLRLHLHLNRGELYGTKKNAETGERVWYALPMGPVK